MYILAMTFYCFFFFFDFLLLFNNGFLVSRTVLAVVDN